MSSFQTHMLVGAVGGLVLARALAPLGIAPPVGAGTLISQLGTSLPLVLLSALLATVPDIDEPGSFIARRARAVLTLTGMGLAGYAAFAAQIAPVLTLLVLVGGALVGHVVGVGALRLIRHGAGGHRRLTHSLVLALAFAVAAYGLWRAQAHAWALVPAGLAWAIVIHDVADVVTPAGVPLLYPFSGRSVRVLPEPICRMGEPLVAAGAIIVAVLLVQR